MSGLHIAFEGTTGAGKTTHSKALAGYLEGKYFREIVLAKSPNGTDAGGRIVQIVFDRSMTPVAEILAFAAAYAELVNLVIAPALKRGAVVISDRGVGSWLAYALYRRAGCVSERCVSEILETIGCGNSIWPDVTFYLDVPVLVGFARKLGCADMSVFDLQDSGVASEAHGLSFLAKKYGWYKIDTTLPERSIQKQVVKVLQRYLQN